MLPISRCKRYATAILSAAVLATSAACGDQGVPVVEGVIDRQTFIETYVDLRAAAVRAEDLTIPEEERDRILERHGVDEQSLLAFVDAYGAELDFMNELWAEVERRVEALPPVGEEESGA